jgi:hypothetical protein
MGMHRREILKSLKGKNQCGFSRRGDLAWDDSQDFLQRL